MNLYYSFGILLDSDYFGMDSIRIGFNQITYYMHFRGNNVNRVHSLIPNTDLCYGNPKKTGHERKSKDKSM